MRLGALVVLAVVGVLAAVALPSCAHAPAPGYHFTAAADGGYVFSPAK